MQKFSSIVVVSAAAMACAQGAFAQTKTWIGTTSSVWGLPANWSPSGVPSATDDVLIPAGATPVTVTAFALARSLDLRRNIELSADMSINGGGISMQGATMTLASGAELEFIGGTQSISATSAGGRIRGIGTSAPNNIYARNCNLTIGQNVIIELSGTAIGINPVHSSGQFGTVNVLGTLSASDGVIFVYSPLVNFDAATKSLNGGRWIINDRGSIRIDNNLPPSIDIDVIGANTFVSWGDGAAASTTISPLDSINVNLGTMEFRNRDSFSFTPPGGTFQNAGLIRVGEGCRFNITSGNFRTLPGSTLEMIITGQDANLQQPRIVISGAAQFNNTGTLRPISNVVPFDCGTSFTLFQHASRVGTIGTIQTVPSSTTVNAVYSNVPNTQIQVTGNCQGQSICDDIDFNNNAVFPEDEDVIDFFTVLAGGDC